MTGPLADRRHLDPTLCVRCGLGTRRRRDDGTRGQWCGACFAAVVALLSRNNARRLGHAQAVPISLNQPPAPLVTCRYAKGDSGKATRGAASPCGQFGTELHQAAAVAGVCCTVAAFDLQVAEVAATPHGEAEQPPERDGWQPDWPAFEPGDDDVPAGAW